MVAQGVKHVGWCRKDLGLSYTDALRQVLNMWCCLSKWST